MRRRRTHHDSTEVALANFSLTFAKALLVFCVAMFVLISANKDKDGTKPKAEFLITVDWTGDGKYDVDTWMRLPDGSRINYHNRESGIAFLERDDLGNDCNRTTSGGKPVDACEEITVLRGIVPGDYVIALHLFSANLSSTPGPVRPVQVHVKIEKLNPDVKAVWNSTVTLDTVREEKGVVRFTLDQTGEASDFETDDLPALVYSEADQ